MMKPSKEFMNIAIKEAEKSYEKGGYPIGAVIIKNDKIIAGGRSLAKTKNDPTSHAEIDAIRNATQKLDSMYLEDCILYTTLEPCAMCTAASVWAKLKGIVYGATMEDAIKFACSVKDKDISLSYRQIRIKCRDVIKKSDNKPEIIEGFERKKCIRLFELSRQNQ